MLKIPSLTDKNYPRLGTKRSRNKNKFVVYKSQKMKKVLFLSIFTLSCSGVLQAQEVSYRILTDDPDEIKPLSISLEPFYFDLYPKNMNMGYSVRADLLFLKRLELRADFRGAYLDFLIEDAGSGTYTAKNDPKKAMYMEAGASLFFTNKKKKVTTKLVLSSRTVGDYTYTRYIMVPATKRKMWGVRAGLSNNRLVTELTDGQQGYMEKIRESDGTRDTLVNGAFPMYNVTSLYAGLHWKSVINLVADTDYGKKRSARVNDFYLDLLFAPVVHMGAVKDATGNIYKLETDSKHIKRFGWRLGWVIRDPNRVWMTYKFEMGARPGITSTEGYGLKFDNSFLMFTFGINIPALKAK